MAGGIGAGPLRFHTAVGEIPLTVQEVDGCMRATLTSVETQIKEMPADLRVRLRQALRLSDGDLDPSLALLPSYAGNRHPVVRLATAQALAAGDCDFAQLAALMAEQGWSATVNLVSRIADTRFEARNPFPPGGVREDAATGSAAASLGGYLRHLGELPLPGEVAVLQGHHMGRPSDLTVSIPARGGIGGSGTAVPLAR